MSCCTFHCRAVGSAPQSVVAFVLALFIALFAAAEPGMAQPAGSATGAVTGRVVTADGLAAQDAVVSVASRQLRLRVDGEGAFRFDALPPGSYLLEVSSARHGLGVGRVTVAAADEVEIEIVLEDEIHGERIVVSATPDARGELDLATAVSVLDESEMMLAIEPTIGETLSGEPGVHSTFFAPGSSRPILRGLGGDRVKMMENGLDTLDVSSTSPDHAVGADTLSTDRVEVVRGPATLLYGSNAIGGVVNMIDGRIPGYRPTAALSGQADLRLGSAADERAAALELEGGAGNVAWHLNLLGRETDDYEIPGQASLEGEEHDDDHASEEHGDGEEAVSGVLPNSDLSSRGGRAGMTYFFGDRGLLGVSVGGLDSEYGVPGGHHHEEGEVDDDHGGEEEEEGEEEIRIDLRQRRFDLEGELADPFGPFRAARLRLGVVDYEHAELEGPGEVGTQFFNDAWEGRFELVQRSRGGLDGSIGLQLRRRDLEAVGEEAFIAPAASDSVGIFTFQELTRGALSYQFGLRYESQDTEVRAPGLPDRSFDGVSGSAGIVFSPGERWSLGASVARSVKMPNGEELYSEGVHFATQAFEIGSAGLTEETSVGIDLSLRKRAGRLTGTLNLFFNDFADHIYQRFTGDEVEGFPVLLWTQDDAEFWGAELDLALPLVERAHSGWGVHFLWDFVRAELADGSNLPRIPPQRFGLGLHYRSDRLRAELDVRHVEAQDRLAENETPTPSHTLLGASVSYRLFLARQVIDLVLRGTNLTDEEARNHVSFVKDDVPLPGRDVSLLARVTF